MEEPIEPELVTGQVVVVAGIKGSCKVVVTTPDVEGDLLVVVEDEIGGRHAVKRRLCRPQGVEPS